MGFNSGFKGLIGNMPEGIVNPYPANVEKVVSS